MTMIGMKRPLDLETLSDALPTTCSMSAHLGTDSSSMDLLQISKRQRYAEMMATKAAQAGVPIGVGVRENPFPATRPIESEEIDGYVRKHIQQSKKNMNEGEQPVVNTDRPSEKLYTHEELTSIVSKVVQQRETALREEYNKILNFKLAEQFHSFTRFNQDYISRQIKGNPFSYVS
mmetsp:Transcript_30005/g.96211  ORF Transcript_30005/g.96211 Transcript_30005/m.96211 type:complete len:176 (+) Transcript_30005:723-1250(+)